MTTQIEIMAKPQLWIREIQPISVGFLQMEPTHIHCVACQHVGVSTVRLESVTCVQRFVTFTKMCKNWTGRHDINHYCSSCGCYIGRYIAVGCSERCISKCSRRRAARDAMVLKKEPIDCAERAQLARDSYKEKQTLKEQQKQEVKVDEKCMVEVQLQTKSVENGK